MNSKKRKFLRLEETQQQKALKAPFKGMYWEYMASGQLPYNLRVLFLLSVACSGLFAVVYYASTKMPVFSIMMAILGFFAPYLFTSIPFTLSAKLKEAFDYKELVTTIQSALRATNSTPEAMRMVAASDTLSPQISAIMKDLVKDMTMGESFVDALEKAKDKTSNKYFKIALSIIEINHKIGSDETIDALENIQKSMDATIDNMQLFKDRLNSFLYERMFYLAGIMAIPFLFETTFKETCAAFFEQWYADGIMSLIVLAVIIFQLIMNHTSFKIAEEV